MTSQDGPVDIHVCSPAEDSKDVIEGTDLANLRYQARRVRQEALPAKDVTPT